MPISRELAATINSQHQIVMAVWRASKTGCQTALIICKAVLWNRNRRNRKFFNSAETGTSVFSTFMKSFRVSGEAGCPVERISSASKPFVSLFLWAILVLLYMVTNPRTYVNIFVQKFLTRIFIHFIQHCLICCSLCRSLGLKDIGTEPRTFTTLA